MLILMLLTSAFTMMFVLFVMLCVGIAAVAHHEYPDGSVRPSSGSRRPRLSLRTIVALLRADD
jgi:hypothetical protein